MLHEIALEQLQAEKEVENLLLVLLKNTKFSGKTHAVGGYVRDQYLGKESHDLDVVVEIQDGAKQLTHYLKSLFPNSITTPYNLGAYPIWEITFEDNTIYQNITYKTEGAVIQFADTMKESFPDPNSRQRNVEYATLREDIDRRDFTVNSLLKDLTTGEIKDLTNTSKNDIEKGILRSNPGINPDEIFNADPLRMIRLIRFYCKFNWTIPIYMLKSVKRQSARIKIVSNERIIEELKKIAELGKLAQAIKLMKATNLLQYILPEIQILAQTQQSPKHHEEGNVLIHTLAVLKHAPATIEGQFAALLHDVGKPATFKIIKNEITFRGHEDIGAEIAQEALHRLKLDTLTSQKIVTMVHHHMRPVFISNDRTSNKALRRFIRDVGEDLVNDILDLAEADALGSTPVDNYVPELRERLKTVKQSPIRPSSKPVLTGNEVMEILNVKPGKIVGEANKFLLDVQDEYAEQNKELTKQEAEYLLKNWQDQRNTL